VRIKGGDEGGRHLMESQEQKRLWADLLAIDTPARTPAPENLMEAWTPGRKAVSCELNENSSILAQAKKAARPPTEAIPADSKTAEISSPKPPVTSETAPSTVDREKVADATTSTSGPGGVRAGAGATAGRASPEPGAPPVLASAGGGEPEMRQAEDQVRVFYHMPSNSKDEREAYLIDKTRGFLADHGYQVVRSMERVAPGSFPKHPQVRYFGSQQADEAEQLVKYLNWYFRDEGLKFELKAIGGDYPLMPQGNIEVWVPSPPGWLKSES
jgi:hypothetical protein